MNYTLITSTGKVMQFYILAMAECYQQTLGGVIVSPQILETTSDCACICEAKIKHCSGVENE